MVTFLGFHMSICSNAHCLWQECCADAGVEALAMQDSRRAAGSRPCSRRATTPARHPPSRNALRSCRPRAPQLLPGEAPLAADPAAVPAPAAEVTYAHVSCVVCAQLIIGLAVARAFH